MSPTDERKPNAKLRPIWEGIPAELKRLKQWVLWRYTLRDSRWTKLPLQPDDALADSTGPSTWSSFECLDIPH